MITDVKRRATTFRLREDLLQQLENVRFGTAKIQLSRTRIIERGIELALQELKDDQSRIAARAARK